MPECLKLTVPCIPAFSSSLANNNQIGMDRGHFLVCEKKANGVGYAKEDHRSSKMFSPIVYALKCRIKDL